MNKNLNTLVTAQLDSIRADGLYKTERELESAQGVEITVKGRSVLNFCANNYLGLANDKGLIDAATKGMQDHGYGMASVRFICGTQTQHHDLEKNLAAFVGAEEAILYSSCFDANTGLFEILLTDQDAIISDSLNHASVIDGIRLSKAQRLRYENCNMADLEEKLKEAEGARFRLIATDGVFSMEGKIAPLAEICDLAEKYDAAVMVDESHATGVIGATGRGALEMTGTLGRVDIITSTLGKALGGASGGFTAASADIIDLLRQRSRTYLFSNSLVPSIVAGANYLMDHPEILSEKQQKLKENSAYFRAAMQKLGFTMPDTTHPIVAVMLGDAVVAKKIADDLLEEGIYVIGFWYPVVPKDAARIRVQISAAHTTEQLDKAIAAFTKIGQKHGVISPL
jgi:glycine C-acetyltransferase